MTSEQYQDWMYAECVLVIGLPMMLGILGGDRTLSREFESSVLMVSGVAFLDFLKNFVLKQLALRTEHEQQRKDAIAYQQEENERGREWAATRSLLSQRQ